METKTVLGHRNNWMGNLSGIILERIGHNIHHGSSWYGLTHICLLYLYDSNVFDIINYKT